MNEQLKKLIEVLSELRNASIKSTPDTIVDTMHKYDMLFIGENISSILSIELAHSLEKIFNINIKHEDLLELIPVACKSLNMKFEKLIQLSDNNSTKDYCYQIQLW